MTDTQTSPGDIAPEHSDKLDKGVLMVAGVVVLGAIMSILDITVVSVALNTFQQEFDATAAEVRAAAEATRLDEVIERPPGPHRNTVSAPSSSTSANLLFGWAASRTCFTTSSSLMPLRCRRATT